MKIAILGYAGSGKSTLAKRLSAQYHLPLLYLDTVQFVENWKERDRGEAAAMVADFLHNPDWVIDGNYPCFLLKERLEAADSILFLSFSRPRCLLRVLGRYRRYKNTTRESMAEGCCEKIDGEFLWWVLYQGRCKKRRRFYGDLLGQHREKVVVISNQRQLEQWTSGFAQRNPPRQLKRADKGAPVFRESHPR